MLFKGSIMIKWNHQAMPMALKFELNIVKSINFYHYILCLAYNDDILIIFKYFRN